MAKKSKRSKQKHTAITASSPVDKYLDVIGQQMMVEDYEGVITNCERLLNYLPVYAPQRAEVLGQLGLAHGMLTDYPQSYKILTEALTLEPENVELWYNRSMASFFTSRFGRALRDIERAIELDKGEELTDQLKGELVPRRKAVQEALKHRGPDFTLDQLIEQEDIYQRGLKMMEQSQWTEAEQAFRESIAISDCLAQPWANLAGSLVMQERYDEAEAAWKRALVIEPTYELAKKNLAALPEIRRTGPPAPEERLTHDPFKNGSRERSIVYLKK